MHTTENCDNNINDIITEFQRLENRDSGPVGNNTSLLERQTTYYKEMY